MSDQATVEPPQQNKSHNPVVMTIVLLLEVFAFMGAVFGFALTDSLGAKANAQVLTLSKIAERQVALVQRVSADLSQIAASPNDTIRDAAPAKDLAASETIPCPR